MTDIVSRMIDTQLLHFLYMICGFIVSRLNIIREDKRGVLVRLLMDVAMPMMVVNAFPGPPPETDREPRCPESFPGQRNLGKIPGPETG